MPKTPTERVVFSELALDLDREGVESSLVSLAQLHSFVQKRSLVDVRSN